MDLPLVVGVDGSEPSLRALDWAADEAALHGVPLRVVYACLVVGVSDAPTRAVRVAYEEARRRKAVLEAVRTWRRPSHETVDHPLLTGSSELLHEERAAKELDAALADAPPDVTLHRRTAEGHARHVLLAASQEERREETRDVVSFLLRPSDGEPAPPARAGQYVSVRLRMPDGVHQIRQYSLSNAPGEQMRRITVKRVEAVAGAPEGEVSNQLHGSVRTGDELTLSAPFGDVVLDDTDTPLLLISAGIGCTPMTGMLAHLAAGGDTRPVHVLHADRSPADHALRAETHRLVGQLPDARARFWYERDAADEPGARTGLMDLAAPGLPENADVYLCGPVPFMRAIRSQLLRAGIPARHIRYEVFGPDLWLAHAED
ncbi:universal stress protein [Streptomyces sp. NPDC092370]|uniref:universal stress protein n=1 Tax=Streptomyces sp. NPDC092370 TaxID=3366016 RepID=UPI00382E09CE